MRWGTVALMDRRYYCDPREGQIGGRAECQGLGGRGLDEAVLAEVFRVLEPAALAATVKALAEAETAEETRLAGFRAAAEKALYGAERARQFDACEPENRLVARGLEAAWETRLRAAEQADAELAAQQARRPTPLSDDELALLARAGADLRAVFDAPTTTTRDRKLLLRTLITDVTVVVDTDAGAIQATINWQGGATSRLDPLPLRRQRQTFRVTDEDTISLIRRLADHYDDATIAAILARQHRRTATGLRFTRQRVCNIRASNQIPCYTETVGAGCNDPCSACARPRPSSACPQRRSTGGSPTASSPATNPPRTLPGGSASTTRYGPRSPRTPPPDGCHSTRRPAS
jgi:hypothetical protein